MMYSAHRPEALATQINLKIQYDHPSGEYWPIEAIVYWVIGVSQEPNEWDKKLSCFDIFNEAARRVESSVPIELPAPSSFVAAREALRRSLSNGSLVAFGQRSDSTIPGKVIIPAHEWDNLLFEVSTTTGQISSADGRYSYADVVISSASAIQLFPITSPNEQDLEKRLIELHQKGVIGDHTVYENVRKEFSTIPRDKIRAVKRRLFGATSRGRPRKKQTL